MERGRRGSDGEERVGVPVPSERVRRSSFYGDDKVSRAFRSIRRVLAFDLFLLDAF